jgi:hypothetical protein
VIRKRIRAVMVLLAMLATPAAVFVAPQAANASTPSLRLCEAYGGYCLGVSGSLDVGKNVFEANPGRYFIQVDQHQTFEGHETYLIKFAQDTTKCIGRSDDLSSPDVTVKSCSANGVFGIVWAEVVTSAGNLEFINRYASQQLGFDEYLTGNNTGTGFMVVIPQYPGFKQFDQLG